jgi:hypothetical protein
MKQWICFDGINVDINITREISTYGHRINRKYQNEIPITMWKIRECIVKICS